MSIPVELNEAESGSLSAATDNNLPANSTIALAAGSSSPIRPAGETATRAEGNLDVVTIECSSRWKALDLRELWGYREPLYFLIWRDIKVRYKQTVIGAAWTVLQPLLAMTIFTVFFAGPARLPSEGIPYPLFAYIGFVVWTFVSNAVAGSSNSLISNSHLITKVYFPRLLLPLATVGARLLDFAVTFVLLIALMIYYHVPVTWNLLWLPWLMALMVLLCLGLGLWLSALNVKYRDVGLALPHLIQFWFFVSPIFYSSGMLPEKLRWFLLVNPLTGLLNGFRAALVGQPLQKSALAASITIALLLFVYGAYAFQAQEESVTDYI